MRKIRGIKAVNGCCFKRLTPEFKGDQSQYISKFYQKGYNTGLGIVISNYWQVNANRDNFEACKGCFSHWD